MATKYAASNTYTDQELLDLYREALAKVSLGQAYTINGRTLTRVDQQMIRETIDWLQSKVNAAQGHSDNLVRFKRKP